MTCCIRSFCLSYQIFFKVGLSGNLRLIFSLLFCKLPDSKAFFFFNSCSFFRFEQPSEWNPSSIHERSVCGAVPHSTCQTEVEQKTGLLIFWLRKHIWDHISRERVLNFWSIFKATIFNWWDQMKCKVNMKLYQRGDIESDKQWRKKGPAKTLFLQILTSPLPPPFLLVHLL